MKDGYFHGGNTGSNPVGDAKSLQRLTLITSKMNWTEGRRDSRKVGLAAELTLHSAAKRTPVAGSITEVLGPANSESEHEAG